MDDKDVKQITKRLRILRQLSVPPVESLSRLMNRLNKSDVTNQYSYRYNGSMQKFAIPALIIVVLVIAAGYLILGNHPAVAPEKNPATSQNTAPASVTLTSSNADQVLQQTSQQIQQTTDQMDNDLKSLDQNSSSENDLNNL